MKLIILSILLVSVLSHTFQDDLVESMPGWGKIDYNLYSGYLNADDAGLRKLHYFFLESQNDPQNDDLIIWLNGGPGCSSLLGLIQENGPFQFKGINTEFTDMSEYSWNREANVLYIESPAGVGFSTIDGEYTYSDDNTANDMMHAYAIWLDLFEESDLNIAGKKTWITGESYAGMYIPFFTNAILDYNEKNDNRINIQGFAIGNGAWILDWNIIVAYQINTYVVQQFMNRDQANLWYDECLGKQNEDSCVEFIQDYVNIANNTDHYSVYNYTYSYASGGGIIANEKQMFQRKVLQMSDSKLAKTLYKLTQEQLKSAPKNQQEDGEQLTPDSIMQKYFNSTEVKEALHVDQSIDWQMCNMTINEQYNSAPNSTYLYPRFFDAGLQVLTYSGNSDAAVQIKYTWECIEDLINNKEYGAEMTVSDEWRQWKQLMPNQQMGGMIQYWDASPKSDSQFAMAMVRAAGHEVPEYQPEASYYMIKQFINGEKI
ncbi:hypothetical protein PPERSA_05413 [Pseudocohnilembus persalinus]|uniref:Carboxypeptidase n=1 Tax=Pseudocohnilembus persalinus TaxID=266149 RepID=A0A0V0R7X2_PSEPJ|nr:hypothetical protein PPERSA_05413 [Pseudocohnilembus persalinus]|eukprot:KRX10593.1 hypothetical protein PPERSA_05413 [Pseudocohnilembus persalinus]